MGEERRLRIVVDKTIYAAGKCTKFSCLVRNGTRAKRRELCAASTHQNKLVRSAFLVLIEKLWKFAFVQRQRQRIVIFAYAKSRHICVLGVLEI